MVQPLYSSDDLKDIVWRFRMDAGAPVLFEPRLMISRPSSAEILAEAMDLFYDVMEHPVALDRMADDGCPNEDGGVDRSSPG